MDTRVAAIVVGFILLAGLVVVVYLDLKSDLAAVEERSAGHLAWHAANDGRGSETPPVEAPPMVAHALPTELLEAEPTIEPAEPALRDVPLEAELPDTPARSDILAAFRSAEGDVHACAGAAEGVTTVRVTIVGATGRVETARVQGRFGGTPEGECISEALKRVTFPRSQRPRFLVTYPYWLRGHGGASADGELDRSALVRVVNRNRASLQRCYEMAIRDEDDPEPSRVDVDIAISPSGVVTTADVRGDDVGPLRDCVSRAVRRWQFPTSAGETRATFPVILRPR